MFTEEEKQEIYENTFMCSIGAIWQSVLGYSENFEVRKEFFIEYLRYLLNESKAKLVKKNVFLEGTIEEQLNRFYNSFPSEQEMQEVETYWWFLDNCPADIVWISDIPYGDMTTLGEDGKYYYWTN